MMKEEEIKEKVVRDFKKRIKEIAKDYNKKCYGNKKCGICKVNSRFLKHLLNEIGTPTMCKR